MIGLLVNPNSRKNRHRPSRVRRYEKILGRHGCVVETPSVDSIVPALRRFAAEGRRYWVADGGDGALHWMINEAVRHFGLQRAAEMAVYVPTGNGTIDFVARVIGLRGTPQEVLARLVTAVREGREVTAMAVPPVSCTGQQVVYGDEVAPWRRVGFGCAFAGYGANFFGPLYRGNKEYGAPRIVKLLGAAIGAGVVRAAMPGVLERLKPESVTQAERDFLRPLHAEVRVDGAPLRGEDGRPLRLHTMLHAASVPVNLANVLRVFPDAGGGRMHIHAGDVTVAEVIRALPHVMAGRSVNHLLRDAYDGVATELEITCDAGDEMSPVLDGEVFYRVTSLRAAVGPAFQLGVP
jgi:diacylglycerol kinase family enzyme